jgi:glyoxylase-like metal-dependent hydrolase (beta-lactamase superfamily II)
MKRIAAALLVALAATPAAAQTQPPLSPPTPVREITKIAGEVYRFRNNNHYSVFAVTPAGVIATDPINADAAQWLKAEIAKRFNQPIRYVIYSHDHWDHISGGQVFADTAIIVAHENAKAQILGEKRNTAVPQLTFSDQMRIELGGTVVELSYVGKNHSNNSIVMRFPKERILFAVDFIPVKQLAWREFLDGYMPDWVESLRRVEAMDFDILAPGHGALGSKADVVAFREYLSDLYTGVLDGVRAGKTVEALQAELTLEKYKSWGNYEAWRALNIQGVYRLIQASRIATPRPQ